MCEIWNQILKDPSEWTKWNKNFWAQWYEVLTRTNRKWTWGSLINSFYKTTPRFNFLIEKVQIKWINYERGCNAVGQFGKMDLHESIWLFNMVEWALWEHVMIAREIQQHSKFWSTIVYY